MKWSGSVPRPLKCFWSECVEYYAPVNRQKSISDSSRLLRHMSRLAWQLGVTTSHRAARQKMD